MDFHGFGMAVVLRIDFPFAAKVALEVLKESAVY